MNRKFFWVLTIVISVGFVLWLYSSDGVSGLVKWEIKYRMYFICILIICFLQAIFAGISLLYANRVPLVFKAICNVGAGLLCSIFVGAFFLTHFLGTYTPKTRKVLNNIPSGDTLKVHAGSSVNARIAIASDPHWNVSTSNAEKRTEILRRISNGKYDAFFCLGDISEIGALPNAYIQPVKDFTTYLGNMPIRVIRGNHDALVNTRKKFAHYFSPTGKHEPYFRISGSGIHFLFLNLLWGTEDWTKAQETWLISELEKIPREDAVVVLSHCFYYSSGYVNEKSDAHWYDLPDMIEQICPIFRKYEVDLVVSGHSHTIGFFRDENVHYAIIGAMGGKPDDGNAVTYFSEKSVWEGFGEYSWLDLQFTPNKINLIFARHNGEEIYRTEVPTR